jgi:CDP-glycerol glycerophosphotransferase (TagB/SpsB family)
MNYDLDRFHIRFVEGEYRRRELDARSRVTEQERPVVGLSKLDPAVQFTSADREASLLALGLNPSFKTVLYAPTYYPSSIELMGEHFPDDCRDLNVIIKPHQFTYTSKYKSQIRVLDSWKRCSNVYSARQEDFNILPFFSVSDVMISDESSAIFEFAALSRPVIRNRFVKLRLSYRLFPWKLRKRMDADIERYSGIARDAHDYKETLSILRDVLATPPVNQLKISQYSHDLIGEVDGRASERIVDYLLSRRLH